MSEFKAKKKTEHNAAVSSVQRMGEPGESLRSFRMGAEIHAISRALGQTGWNRRRAAQLLSISYRGLLYKIRQHNITQETGAELMLVRKAN